MLWAMKRFSSWSIQGRNRGASLLSYSLATTVQDLANSSDLAPFFMIIAGSYYYSRKVDLSC